MDAQKGVGHGLEAGVECGDSLKCQPQLTDRTMRFPKMIVILLDLRISYKWMVKVNLLYHQTPYQ